MSVSASVCVHVCACTYLKGCHGRSNTLSQECSGPVGDITVEAYGMFSESLQMLRAYYLQLRSPIELDRIREI